MKCGCCGEVMDARELLKCGCSGELLDVRELLKCGCGGEFLAGGQRLYSGCGCVIKELHPGFCCGVLLAERELL